jgi:hypothetical protein
MGDKKVRWGGIVVGLSLVLLGFVLTLCSRPVFNYTREIREELQQVPKSEIIMDYSFDVDRSQDKIVQVQLSIGQNLSILAIGSGTFNFSIANFTDTSHAIQPDQPDVVYVSLDNATSINITWTPQVRIAQPGNYYLVFLARDASPDSPVQINANVTKIWTEIQIRRVEVTDRKSLIDPDLVYIGLGTAISGAVIFLITVHTRHKPRNRRRT